MPSCTRRCAREAIYNRATLALVRTPSDWSVHFELVVYTDQLQTYVDPILERLDKEGTVNHRLYRDATLYTDGNHVRDLSKLNRPITHIIYLSAKPEVSEA
eukprot:3215621-Pyramimonas_sp.AAC.1